MNEELTRKVTELIQSAQDQAPEIVQEYLRWAVVVDWIWIIVGSTLFISLVPTAIFCIRQAIKESQKSYSSAEILLSWVMCGALSFTIGFIGSCIAISNASELLHIYLAPRMFVLEHLAHIARGTV